MLCWADVFVLVWRDRLEEAREDLEDHGIATGMPVRMHETVGEVSELCIDRDVGICKLLVCGPWHGCNTGMTAGASALAAFLASGFVSCLLWHPVAYMLPLGEPGRRPTAASAEPARLLSISDPSRLGMGVAAAAIALLG